MRRLSQGARASISHVGIGVRRLETVRPENLICRIRSSRSACAESKDANIYSRRAMSSLELACTTSFSNEQASRFRISRLKDSYTKRLTRSFNIPQPTNSLQPVRSTAKQFRSSAVTLQIATSSRDLSPAGGAPSSEYSQLMPFDNNLDEAIVSKSWSSSRWNPTFGTHAYEH